MFSVIVAALDLKLCRHLAMKTFLKCSTLLLIAASPYVAAQDNTLLINNQALTLTLKDNNQAQVSSCKDYINLHNSGSIITDIPGLSDPDYQAARMALMDCWVEGWAIKNGYVPKQGTGYTISEVIASFPASTAFAVNDGEKGKIKAEYKGKTLKAIYPDLKKDDENLISPSKNVGYHLYKSWHYVNAEGKKADFIALTGYATGGTMALPNVWRVNSTSEVPWNLSAVDQNTPF
ncbi:hypothetical protein B5K64_003598 [Escherichia coli]|nr:hypothetical protein [Escherichia coli]